MKFLKTFSIFTLVIACTFISIACSNGKSPAEPQIDKVSGISNDLPGSMSADMSNRSPVAVYDAVIDPSAKTFTIIPIERSTQYHFPLTQLFPNVLKITGYGFTPNFWADIKLSHPMPGSGIDGFDPRVIAILPANPGVRFIYPALGVGGNNAVVLEPDGYTKLFDELGGTIPGNVNPFKAYFQNQTNRRWSSYNTTEEIKRWQMNIAGFGGPLRFKLAVDVSTNYPNPPTPFTDNSPEPVKIIAIVGSGLTTTGGSADITVTLLDWQGQSGIGGVKVEAPDLFSGTVDFVYSAPGPNPNEYVYTGAITNSLLAPEGEYKMLFATWDKATGIYLYKESAVIVKDLTKGNLLWAKRAGGFQSDAGFAITTLSDNSTAVTGYIGYIGGGDTTFGEGETNETILHSLSMGDIFVARYNPDGTLLWAKLAGGTDSDRGIGITRLSDDSIVVTGYFSGSATFGPGETNQKILTSSGNEDIFIARYNPDGTLEWANRAGGLDTDGGYDITTLSYDAIIITGTFGSSSGHSATFGPGEINETILTPAGNCDIFIARYNPDGTLKWAKRAGGADQDIGSGITTLSDNSTVVTGGFRASATFGPGETNQTILTSPGGVTDIFIARYNPDGTLVWAKRAGGSSSDAGSEITNLSDNSTVVIGSFNGSATFGPGEPNQTILTSFGTEDVFIARYNPDGTLAWAKHAGGTYIDEGSGITSLSNNSIVVAGSFSSSTITFGPGEPNQTVLTATGGTDMFIAGYHSDGMLSWAKSVQMTASDWGYATAITALSDNSTVATGYFRGSATFGFGEPNQTILTSDSGYWDLYVARFKP